MIVVRDEELAQQALAEGSLRCPHRGCGDSVYRDGYARRRMVRTRAGGERELRPQRVARRRCGRTNVLLPAWWVPGRSDDAETIGSALLAAAQGQGHRSIAAKLDRPATTVRGWLRAARGHVETLRAQAYTLQGRVESPSKERLLPACSGLADAVAALAAAAAAAKRFLGADRYRTTLWEYIVLITGGRLLRPRPRATG